MSVQNIARFVMGWCLVLLPAAAWAQVASSGALAGVARDTSGAVLPGVTVEAASPALIEKVRTAVTDGQGLYRIVDLRPGTYTVTFTLPGFSPFRREGVALTTGFTATVNAELRVGTLEETVTVSGAAPVVDTQNVRQQTVFSREVIDALPVNKGIQAYAALTPGAVLQGVQDVGGSRVELTASFGVHGARPQDLRLLQDGMLFNVFEGNASGATSTIVFNPASAQEVTVETSGMSAESQNGGAQFNIVPKEGANRFSAFFVTNYANEELQNSNLTDTLRARGVTAQATVKKLYDVNAGVGGPIRKDKLWFYSGHRWLAAEQYVPGNYFNKTQDSWFYTPDLSRPAHTDDLFRDNNLRLTWQASQKNKFNFAYHLQNHCRCYPDLTGNVAPEAVSKRIYLPNWVAQASWSYPATNRLLFEAGTTAVILRFNLDRQPGVSPDHITVLELSNNYRYRAAGGSSLQAGAYGITWNKQINERFAVSYITGSHAFKTGLYLMEGWRRRYRDVNGDLHYTFRNGRPISLTQWATPHTEKNRLMPDLGIYAQDQWTIRKLTLNLGVRFDYLKADVPEQHLPSGQFVPARDFAPVKNVPNWTDLAPRLGAAYDLFGTGKTAIKAFLGRYVAPEANSFAIANNPANTMVVSATRTWSDANGDFIPQPSELGPLSDAAFGQVKFTTRYAEDVSTGWGVRGFNWQGSVSVQHELRPSIALNVGYFRTWYGNFNVTDNLAVTSGDYDPFCITAPVDRRLPGGGGQQMCGLYDLTPTLFGQVDNLITQASHYGTQTEVYNGVDVTLNARFGGGQLSGGLSTGRTVTDECFVVDSPQQARPGFCKVSRPWAAATQVKFLFVYSLPWNLQTSAVYQNIPGIPITASYVATNAEIRPSLGRNLGACRGAATCNATAVIDLITPNTIFEDRLQQLDLRFTRPFRMGNVRVQGNFDVYNVLNVSSILRMNTRYGPAWLRPDLILGGRMFKFGVQVDY